MKAILTIAAITFCLLMCVACSSGSAGSRKDATRFTEDEKHRLYAAALAASDSPLDSDLFKEVCRKLGIFDASGRPNNRYMSFVSEHLNWSMEPQTDQFKQEINSKEKAREYINRHMP